MPLPVIFTDPFDRLHVGPRVTRGVIAQLRFTVPVNDPVAAKAKVKVAACPAVMVCESEEPGTLLIEKSGTA